MTEKQELEHCLQAVNAFCDWVREADRQLESDLRQMRGRHRCEAKKHLSGMLSHAERKPA
jgi:hypothetical protein